MEMDLDSGLHLHVAVHGGDVVVLEFQQRFSGLVVQRGRHQELVRCHEQQLSQFPVYYRNYHCAADSVVFLFFVV